MKLQRTTLILLLMALGLGSVVYFLESQGLTQRQESQENKQQIFTFTADDVRSLNINQGNLNITIEHSTSPNPPKWLLKSPVSSPANNASVSYLMDLLVQGKIERVIDASSNQLNEFGLDQPMATIEIKLKNQKNYQLILGKPDFNDRFLYAQTKNSNQADGKINVLLVSKDFSNAVNRELSEWQQTNNTPPNNQMPNSTPLPVPTFTPSP
ncbi:DUF4340 domain-containing protein [Calothrix sp. UHCC 0171]|uniref:DUF4340 domain-containing protein n=1 Tax=Calothrix sp. UHCC 0171 TaxID=3110245 RepID=UPI002B1F0684|nr:DUF4340 domain-containing protein [Calothrix sp. UHCC 0171]MEA5569878.1 DUF4340 domain-containing protein [Calothrix sp. UHCC 0171]